jgi:hypothetical protein
VLLLLVPTRLLREDEDLAGARGTVAHGGDGLADRPRSGWTRTGASVAAADAARPHLTGPVGSGQVRRQTVGQRQPWRRDRCRADRGVPDRRARWAEDDVGVGRPSRHRRLSAAWVSSRRPGAGTSERRFHERQSMSFEKKSAYLALFATGDECASALLDCETSTLPKPARCKCLAFGKSGVDLVSTVQDDAVEHLVRDRLCAGEPDPALCRVEAGQLRNSPFDDLGAERE